LNSLVHFSPHRPAAASTAIAPLLQGPRRAGHLLGASPAAIYAVFDDLDGTPGVVGLLPSSSVRLPVGLVVVEPLPVPPADAPVAVGDGALSVGDEVWVPTRWFDPRPPSLGRVVTSRLAVAARVLWALSAAEVGVDIARARAAVAALAAGDAQPACALLGGGPGLTPAGDDVIAGALAAHALLAGESASVAVPEVLKRARQATTSLSAALLACAAAGQVVPEAADFLAALGGDGEVGGEDEVKSALARLRCIGSTSGTALAVGIVAALEAECRDTR
jgi:Protein of unknown function (DUF2877)